MNEYVGLLLMTLLWVSLSYIFFRYLKHKHKKKPINLRKLFEFNKHYGDDLH